MTSTLTDDERQTAYNNEHPNIAVYANKLSDLNKYLWAGALAVFFALATAAENTPSAQIFASSRILLFGAVLSAILAIIFDFFHYMFGLWHARHIEAWIKANRTIDRRAYREKLVGWRCKAATLFMVLKSVSSVSAGALLFVSMIRALL